MKTNLWFRRKTYGWGWTPTTWQGWIITTVFLAVPLCIKFFTKYLELTKGSQNFYVLASLPLVFVGLLLICLRHGEKPRWQWGIKTTKLSHLEILVSNYRASIIFYDLILLPLGWERIITRTDHTAYTDGTLKLILSPVEEKYLKDGYHRKHIGLNHLAFYAQTKDQVDQFSEKILRANGISQLNENEKNSNGDTDYYAVCFEDPDRIKLELVYAPHYCEKAYWPNTLENDFDPNS
ncbi:MAG: VOC family protein [Bacteriovorax sp.]|nr:VOC family protein [Bacteriovorax sp.]